MIVRGAVTRCALVVALAGATAACAPDPVVPSATPAPMTCAGITGDDASSLGDSAATVGLLNALNPATGFISFPDATVTAHVPATTPVSTAADVRFDLDWGTLAPGAPLLKTARELLALGTVDVGVEAVSVSASGAATDTWTTSAPVATFSTSAPLTLTRGTVTGTIHPAPGTVTYHVTSVRLTVRFDTTVAGVLLKTLRLTCSTTAALPSTEVVA